jgi:UDPglucose--hexose-1-phosphate uridylyltransferase
MTRSIIPEYRTDVLTGQQVLVAPIRSSRPSAVQPDPTLVSADDPFVEGNETETPQERLAIRDQDSQPNGPGWKLRVVPNRYPGVIPRTLELEKPESSLSGNVPRESETRCPREVFPSEPAWGEHDVVIECPDSRSRLAELSTEEVQLVFVAWRTRIQQLKSTGRHSSVAVFRNEGFSAGASLAHCHSQIMATEQLTPLDSERHQRAAQYRQRTGRDLFDDLLNAELANGSRIIGETAEFTVLCPFAPRTSWHVRFIPRTNQHQSFSETTDAQLDELAGLLKQTLDGIEQELGTPFSFNLTLPHPRLDQPPEFSWMLDLLPRIGRSAGWEYLSSIEIVTVTPEHSAMRLRSVLRW